MLIEFAVGNFRSFHEEQVLSMLAAPLREPALEEGAGVFRAGKHALLRSAAVYGANASGKSNLVRAVMFMRNFVLNSATRLQSGEPTGMERFALDILARQKPAYFQIVFLLDGVQYRYGFQADEKQVYSEWLYRKKHREARLFVRERQDFDVSSRLGKAASLAGHTRPNALFLSVLAQFNNPLAVSLLGWFRDLRGVGDLDDLLYKFQTFQRLDEDDAFRQRVRMLLRLADVGIVDIEAGTFALGSLPISEEARGKFEKWLTATEEILLQDEDPFTFRKAITYHPVFDGEQVVGRASFDLEQHESAGTQKFLYLLEPWLDTLEKGSVLVVDEIDTRLHPLLVCELVRMFQSPKSNPHNAQLIFVTHDAGLLGERILRRDQVWFTEKNRFGATTLYSLAEMKVRNDASYYKNYLLGLYGATPHVSGLRPFVEQEMMHGQETEEVAG